MYIFKKDYRVIIEVDNPGMLAEKPVSLLQPGVTSKEGHTGLGLYIVKQIVEKYNGTMVLENIDNRVLCRLELTHQSRT
ncbi:hypothetical protein N752_30005 [Desulforamulus aquiferis]|nr:ATP-binding protein [Desulforamulus aquiferis]RYD01537.1 hypothetical protein N752_30005 [Desulforamulus aquiferis]